jgi:RNA recognition motif-containing protein
LQIKGVRLPRNGDAETGCLKDFGYVDFKDRASLVKALSMNEHTLKNRKLRIGLAAGRRGNSRDDEDRPNDRNRVERSGCEPSREGPSYGDRDKRDGCEPVYLRRLAFSEECPLRSFKCSMRAIRMLLRNKSNRRERALSSKLLICPNIKHLF